MTGFRLHININNKPDDIRFRLYDNGELVVDDIAEFDFTYLISDEPTDSYTGTHTLSMTYYQEFNPGVESSRKVIFTKDFTLPVLDYTVDVSII